MDIQSQKLTNIVLLGVFVLIAYMAFVGREMTVDMNQTVTDRTITVDGKAETFVKPDTAKVSFGITLKNASTAVATQSVNERMNALMTQLTALGVAEKDVKTISYDIYPEYNYNDGRQIFDGYRVTQRVEVVMRDLEKVSQVLDIVNSAELDNVSQLSFYVDDEDTVKKQLREEAIADAKANAEKIAKDLGVRLDQVVGFYDNSNDRYEPMPVYDMAREGMGGAESSVAPSIPEGENQFNARVSVTYKVQ